MRDLFFEIHPCLTYFLTSGHRGRPRARPGGRWHPPLYPLGPQPLGPSLGLLSTLPWSGRAAWTARHWTAPSRLLVEPVGRCGGSPPARARHHGRRAASTVPAGRTRARSTPWVPGRRGAVADLGPCVPSPHPLEEPGGRGRAPKPTCSFTYWPANRRPEAGPASWLVVCWVGLFPGSGLSFGPSPL